MIYSGSQSSIYFLIVLMYSNLVGHAVNSNLYSEFNNGLDRMSNYAENRVKEETSPTLEEIYDHNGELLKQYLQNIPVENVRNVNKLSEVAGIEKLINALSAYTEPLQSSHTPHQFVRRNSKVESSKSEHVRARQQPVRKSDFAKSGSRWRRRNKKFFNDELSLKKQLVCKRAARKKRLGAKTVKRFDQGYAVPDPKSVMNTAPSLYPNVVANSLDVSALSNVQGFPINTANLQTPLSPMENELANSVKQIKEIQNALIANQQSQSIQPDSESSASVLLSTKGNDVASRCATIEQPQSQPQPPVTPVQTDGAVVPSPDCNDMDPGNIKNVLEKVLCELESIKQCKGNSTPDGAPCSVMGSWNSEVVGLRFDISLSESKNVNVEVQERCPAKRHAWMDTDWMCTGGAVKSVGGPFYIIAEKPEENILATFSGLCKVCGGTDMVFGSWTIVHPAKDCQDMQLTIETKRDIFRRNLLPKKKKERLDLINRLRRRLDNIHTK